MSASPVAVVTGANRGIGLEIARGLVAAGQRVIGTARDLATGGAAIRDAGAEPRSLDVADADSRRTFAHGVAADPGGVDVLVHNAGVALSGFDGAVARTTVEVNALGAIALTDALLPQLRDGARIVHVSSGLGELSILPPPLRARFEDETLDRARLRALLDEFVDAAAQDTTGVEGWPTTAYGVSKVAMNAATRFLARELDADPRRIRVLATCPGWVRTDMGGAGAPRSATEGAATPIWLALGGAGDATGQFFRDEAAIPW